MWLVYVLRLGPRVHRQQRQRRYVSVINHTLNSFNVTRRDRLATASSGLRTEGEEEEEEGLPFSPHVCAP